MKCNCETCSGTGHVECDDCGGAGVVENAIENLTLSKTMPGYKELVELQRDARRCIEMATKLKAMNPARVESYNEQLLGCLAIINKQADKVLANGENQK